MLEYGFEENIDYLPHGQKCPSGGAVNKHCRATMKCGTPISGKIQAINFIVKGFPKWKSLPM